MYLLHICVHTMFSCPTECNRAQEYEKHFNIICIVFSKNDNIFICVINVEKLKNSIKCKFGHEFELMSFLATFWTNTNMHMYEILNPKFVTILLIIDSSLNIHQFIFSEMIFVLWR